MDKPKNLRQLLGRLDALPPIPSNTQKILALKINTDEGEQALLELINRDPPILTRIIGLANSPLFGSSRKILKLHDAAALLGNKRVKIVALSFSMLSFMAIKPGGLLDIHKLWQHSLAVALAMETLANYMPADQRPDDDEIYLVGLLHDIGFLVLNYLDPGLSDRFHARLAADTGASLEDIEDEMLWIRHGELGALLARHWDLPEPIIATLHYHHGSSDGLDVHVRRLAGMAILAEKLLPINGIAELANYGISGEEWTSLGIDLLKASEITGKVRKLATEVAEI